MNLSDDDIQFTGGSNITSTATAVATNIADIKFDLNNSVTISGTMKADTFTTTAATATWVTTVLDGFTSITSTSFTGALTGNASTATALASAGTVGVTGDVSTVPPAPTYTSGGNILIDTTIADDVVTGKILTGLPTPAAATVVATDTILEGFGKLQSQINGIANGLQFQGTWNASMDTGGTDQSPNGTPALTSGGGEATNGTTTATTANKLVDSSASFISTVTVGDRVVNQVDGQTALVTNIDSDTTLSLDANIMLTGEAYIIDKTPFITAGHYYVVDGVGATTARNATLNGIQDWQVGDWVIASTSNVWQKLNNTAVEGSGTQNRLTKWGSVTSTIVDSIVLEETGGIKLDTDKTITTQGTGGNIVVGGAATISGLTTAGAALSLTGGVNLPTGYGTANQVLGNANAAGAAGNDLVWITPTTGTVESVTAGDGIVLTGDAVDPVVNIDYLGTDNAILSATALGTGTIATTDQIWFNDVAVGSDPTTNTLSYAPVSKLPFDNFAGWVLSDNETTPNTTTITSGGTAKFAGGTYITTGEASGTLTITHDDTTRSDTTSTDTPAFGGTFDAVTSVTTNTQGHVTAVDVSTVTVPSNPVFVGPADATTDGVAGIVPAPGQATFNGGYFLKQDATWAIPPDLKGVETVSTTTPIEGGGTATTVTISHKAVLTDAGGSAGTYDSVTVDGNGHVTAGTNPGGGGGGIFSGDQAIVTASSDLTFTLKRTTTGTLIFDVWFTSETSDATSVAKKYVVAHSSDTTPVYNKILDTGPDGSNDFTVTFANATTTDTGDSVTCSIQAVGVAQNIGYTVQVGHDSTNALTFTAAS
jgi:hypothetical protein